MARIAVNGLRYKDVADAAGYAVDTVYDVFRSGPSAANKVRPDTAAAIFDAAERIGFYPRNQVGKWERVGGTSQ